MRVKIEHEVMKFHPDTLVRVREECGLGAPGRVDEAVALLQDWIRHQDHFLKKDFSEEYLEHMLIMAKGSVETVKRRMDLLCTMRTQAPQFFNVYDIRNLKQFLQTFKVIAMPTLTDDNYRVCVYKVTGPCYANFYHDLYNFFAVVLEFLTHHEYCAGYIFIVDPSEANVMDFATRFNLTEIREFLSVTLKGYGLRIKSIHCVTTSKAIEFFVALVKQVLSEKLGSRLKVHKTVAELHEDVPPRLLPQDLGGEGATINEIHEKWIPSLVTEEQINVMKEMQGAGVDEARRRTPRDDADFGLPGSFRTLNVD